MEETREISALLHLIDDPDEEVFGAVTDRIVGFGKPIIPNLEHLWENTPNEEIQTRIELLIHKLHYTDLTEEFRQWNVSGSFDLMTGALLASRFQFPELSSTSVLQDVEKIRRNIWLELNNYLTPLEQIRIVTGILYGYYGLKGAEISYNNINDFLLPKVLESKKGNQLGNGILYLIICDLLDIPVKAIGIPKQFVLAYFKPGYSAENIKEYTSKIDFFIEPASGQVFTQKDIESYFKRISVPSTPAYFRPLSNKRIIQHLLEELSNCFEKDKNPYKKQELLKLAGLLD
ncbi:transglutaminase family protein [Paraflavisolibacter sp. H34]|uniref:transglutaminase family protein n=1 Tax=Huijunlia imazamoxiresistens TaxID=3127457 RepID=UPI00301ACEA7